MSINARQKYEEELKRTYVLEKKITDIDDEIINLRFVTRPITEVKDHEAQTQVDIEVVGEAQYIKTT